MLRRSVATATMAVFMALGVASGVRAGDESNRLSVVARGQASAIADSIELEFTVCAHTDESVEAEKKFRDKLVKVEQALREGEAKGTPAKKKVGDDDDDDAAPKKKKKVQAPPKGMPVPEKAPKKGADDDDDEEPAPKKKQPKKPETKPQEDQPKEDKPSEPKKDADPKAAAAIPVEITERSFTLGVKSTKADDSPMAKMLAMQRGGGTEKADSPMTFGCKVVATVNGIGSLDRTALAKRLAQLIDAAVEAGADGADGESPVVRFTLKDPEALRKTAYKDAMGRAKLRAGELASLAERHLESVVSVSESGFVSPVTSGKPEDMQEKLMTSIYGLKGEKGSALTTMDVSVDVELRVDFQLGK